MDRETKRSVVDRLRDHLLGDGTPNDGTTYALYREAHRVPQWKEVDLETVEQWAFRIMNR